MGQDIIMLSLRQGTILGWILLCHMGGEEHIIELKLWHGQKYREEGIKQV